MKKKILILFTVAIASVNMFAQEGAPPRKDAPKKTPEERAENMTKRMTKEFALTAEQQTKVKVLILKTELEKEKMKNELKEGRAKMEEEMKTILTSEQFQRFKQKGEEMKNKRHDKQMPPNSPDGKNPPAPNPDRK